MVKKLVVKMTTIFVHKLIGELSGESDDFRYYLWMDEETYSLLLSLVSNTIQK